MASSRDMFNLMGALSQPAVDAANREFYGNVTYTWPQVTYPTYADPLNLVNNVRIRLTTPLYPYLKAVQRL